MKLRQLQCLCSVVDAGFNISRASTALHTTQPSVGKHLRQLEEELGAELLLRQGGRLLGLTDAGERALVWARRSLQCTENVRATVRESAGEQGASIDLATSHTLANYVLLPAITTFTRQSPRVRIRLVQGSPDQVAELVRDGKVTLGIVNMPPEIPREVVAVPFRTHNQVLVAPAGHALLKEKQLTLEKLAEYPLIVPVRSKGVQILHKFQQAGLEVNLAVQALNADLMKTYVAAGLGIAIIPSYGYSARQDRALRAREVAHLFEPAVSAALLRRQSYLQQHVYAFLEQIDPGLDRQRVESLVFDTN